MITLTVFPAFQRLETCKNFSNITARGTHIDIYNLMGNKIKSLLRSKQDAGYKSIIWDATNDLGQTVSAGMYVYTIQAGGFRQTKKMLLLK